MAVKGMVRMVVEEFPFVTICFRGRESIGDGGLHLFVVRFLAEAEGCCDNARWID